MRKKPSYRNWEFRYSKFIEWVKSSGIPVESLCESHLDGFRADFKSRGLSACAYKHATCGFSHVSTFFRERKYFDFGKPKVKEEWVEDYERYLRSVKGNSHKTIKEYIYFAQKLRHSIGGSAPCWAQINVDSLLSFVKNETELKKGHGKRKASCAMRSFIKYLVLMGQLQHDISLAIPPVMTWKHAQIPSRLTEEQFTTVMAELQNNPSINCRDRSILLLLAELGLRSSEILGIKFSSLNWVQSSITIQGLKGHNNRILPLPTESGKSLSDYIMHERPESISRSVFLSRVHPFPPLKTPTAITHIVQRFFKRIKLNHQSGGAHVFRHTRASQLVNDGKSFCEVADLLGHKSIQTTQVYAKLNLKNLADIALPWPGITP